MQAIILDSSDDENDDTVRHLKARTQPSSLDDDVIIIEKPFEEPIWRSKRRKREKVVDYSEDCVVLEGDPDKGHSDTATLDNNSDDLVVTAEKGPVACRDFPHSRHLCVKFPFTSTPHEMFCQLCHCYACDKPAPCALWGKGNLDSDHCHASDKEEKWKRERTAIKMSKVPSSLTNINTLLSITAKNSLATNRNNHSQTRPIVSLPSIIAASRHNRLLAGQNQSRPLLSRAREKRSHSGIYLPPRHGTYLPSQRQSSHNREKYDHIRNSSNTNLSLSLNPQERLCNNFSIMSPMNKHSCYQREVQPRTEQDSGITNTEFDDLLNFLINSDNEEVQENEASTNAIGNRREVSNEIQPANPNIMQNTFTSSTAMNCDLRLAPQVNFPTTIPAPGAKYHQEVLSQVPDYVNQTAFHYDYSTDRNFTYDCFNSSGSSPMSTESGSWLHGLNGNSVTCQNWNSVSSQSSMVNNVCDHSEHPLPHCANKNDVADFGFISGQLERDGNPRLDLSLEQEHNTDPPYLPPLCIDINSSWDTSSMGPNPSIYF
eukprot:TRINITY_DN6647_c0_g1_i1.p1 TRINITY_DN6647_c0_g1~~TRINITY_DN6647_c0_g1_i1.p1  ORF type:complete len:543 (+),score=97.12 TRINITY_DN6647_c0_g1_i1:333-1961(+)